MKFETNFATTSFLGSLFPKLWLPAALLLGASATSFAHIDIDRAGTHKSRYGSRQIKEGPCGVLNGKRGTNVYTYKPGETIKVAVDEFVPHPGYFRVAFDNNGDDDFLNPRTVAPLNRTCMNDPADKCGATDFFNNTTVLLDNLNPHKRGLPNKRYS